jgi:hypothetical protein
VEEKRARVQVGMEEAAYREEKTGMLARVRKMNYDERSSLKDVRKMIFISWRRRHSLGFDFMGFTGQISSGRPDDVSACHHCEKIAMTTTDVSKTIRHYSSTHVSNARHCYFCRYSSTIVVGQLLTSSPGHCM